MFKKKNTLNIENFWISIVWVLIFMVVLAWDQEKIVVLNLIIFCYFLKNLAGESITETFEQRKAIISNILTHDLEVQLKSLKTLLAQSISMLKITNSIFLVMLKRFLITINQSDKSVLGGSDVKIANDPHFEFDRINLFLEQAYSKGLKENSATMNLTVADSLSLANDELVERE